MVANVGTVDEIARVVVELALTAYAIPLGFSSTGWNWVGWIGVLPLATAVFRFCPPYSLIGVSTCRAQRT